MPLGDVVVVFEPLFLPFDAPVVVLAAVYACVHGGEQAAAGVLQSWVHVPAGVRAGEGAVGLGEGAVCVSLHVGGMGPGSVLTVAAAFSPKQAAVVNIMSNAAARLCTINPF